MTSLEEVEDYFLEFYDINSINKNIELSMSMKELLRLHLRTKWRPPEYYYEAVVDELKFGSYSELEASLPAQSAQSNIKVVQKIKTYPITETVHSLYGFHIQLRFLEKNKKIKRTIEKTIEAETIAIGTIVDRDQMRKGANMKKRFSILTALPK